MTLLDDIAATFVSTAGQTTYPSGGNVTENLPDGGASAPGVTIVAAGADNPHEGAMNFTPTIGGGWTAPLARHSSNNHLLGIGGYVADVTPPDLLINGAGSSWGSYRSCAVQVETAATDPAQSKVGEENGNIVFDSPPAEGSLLILVATGYGNSFGSEWTLLGSITILPDSQPSYAWIYGRMAGAGESATIVNAKTYSFAWVSEWSVLPVASFIPATTTITEGDTVNFTDTSVPGTGSISAWAWTFGDGGTSTSQNPSHQYTAHGNYDVTLTITVDGVDYIATGIVHAQADVGYTPPLPGLALVEIYVTSPGSARWDEANWDEAVWSSDSWQNVTPESTDVTILWGSQRPELGILSTPDAGSWGIGFFDPDRLLDPANPDSPYFGDIVPGLPVRITHRGTTIKQGILESAGHNFDLNSFQTHHSGYFRVTDSQSLMARSKVPSDTTLGDDLFSRARDAIAAAGLSIHVAPETWASSPIGDVSPIGHVHDLVPWVTGTDWTVWQWISDAAAQVLHVPYVDHLGRLGFRQWNLPKDFGKALRSPNLVGLGSVIFQNGTYSVVKALDDDGLTLRTAELTPKPYYGAVTYDDRATKPTPNAQDWVDAVLADRAVAGLRWVPGEVFPLTANDVHYFAEIEAIERVSIDYVEANPPISATGIVVGGQIVITPVQEKEARWSFLFQVAATADQPLVDDDSPTDFLVNDDDPTDYLYPG